MSFIAAGVAAAGVAASVGSQLLKNKGSGAPAFNYEGGQKELDEFRRQISDRKEWYDQQVAEVARQRSLIAAERDRQKAFTDESNQYVQREIDRYKDVPGQLDTTAKSLADFFVTNSATPTDIMPATTDAVRADAANKLAKVAAYNTGQNTALSNLRSFGDLWGDLDRSSLQDQTHLTNVADFKAGSKSLLPAEIRPIVNRPAPSVTAGDFGKYYGAPEEPDNTFSDILGGVGSIATSYGLSGFGNSGFTGTPAGRATYGSARPTMSPTGRGWIGGGV